MPDSKYEWVLPLQRKVMYFRSSSKPFAIIGMAHSPRILVAPGPFKECLTAEEATEAIARGLRRAKPGISIDTLPLCDGGSGFMHLLTRSLGGDVIAQATVDAVGNPIIARFGRAIVSRKSVGIIESAQVIGLALVPLDKRDPTTCSSYGLGTVVEAAINSGCEQVIIGCGDSATNDGGYGLARALGARFMGTVGTELPGTSVAELQDLKVIDLSGIAKSLKSAKITAACNLTSILCGPDGTSRVYGPQKGATPEQTDLLDRSLVCYAQVIQAATGFDVRYLPGCGGAGGLATALFAFFGAQIEYSMHVVSSIISMEKQLQNCDVVITGEGQIDGRTLTGKIAGYVALCAKKYNKRVIGLCGNLDDSAYLWPYNGFDAIFPIQRGPIALGDSIARAALLIEDTAYRVGRLLE